MTAWANRKAAVQAEAKALADDEQSAIIAEQHAALAEQSEEDVLAELDLPNPDDMQAGDDFSAFMKSTVPAALRNRALRKLWASDPILANVDMLVDYGEDFTGKNDPIGLIKTIYRVGKGMLPDDHDDPESSEDTSPIAEQNTAPENVDHDTIPDVAVAAAAEPQAVVAVTPDQDHLRPPAPRRRMRFEFSQGTQPDSTELDTV